MLLFVFLRESLTETGTQISALLADQVAQGTLLPLSNLRDCRCVLTHSAFTWVMIPNLYPHAYTESTLTTKASVQPQDLSFLYIILIFQIFFFYRG